MTTCGYKSQKKKKIILVFFKTVHKNPETYSQSNLVVTPCMCTLDLENTAILLGQLPRHKSSPSLTFTSLASRNIKTLIT